MSDQSIQDPLLQEQLLTSTLNVCPVKNSNGATVLFLRMKNHNPSKYSAHQTVKLWHYVVFSLLVKDPSLAETGFIFVNNFEGAGLSNIDLNIPNTIISAISNCMPIRINGVYLLNPPWLLHFVVPVVKALVSSKIGQRVNIVTDVQTLPELLCLDVAHVPMELGGTLVLESAEALLEERVKDDLGV